MLTLPRDSKLKTDIGTYLLQSVVGRTDVHTQENSCRLAYKKKIHDGVSSATANMGRNEETPLEHQGIHTQRTAHVNRKAPTSTVTIGNVSAGIVLPHPRHVHDREHSIRQMRRS